MKSLNSFTFTLLLLSISFSIIGQSAFLHVKTNGTCDNWGKIGQGINPDDLYQGKMDILNVSPVQQSLIIDGLTKYITEEFKKGVTITYINRFKDSLSTIGELNTLFPELNQLIQAYTISEYPDFGGEWKQALEKDFSNILNNLEKVLQDLSDKNKYFTTCLIKEKDLFIKALKVGNAINNGSHPVDILSQLTFNEYDYFSTLNFLQSSFKSGISKNKGKEIWVTFEDFKSFNGDHWKEYYCILEKEDPTLYNQIFTTNDSLNKVKIQRFFTSLKELEYYNSSSKMKTKDILPYSRSFLKLINASPMKKGNPSTLIIEDVLDILSGIQSNEIAVIIPNFISIIKQLTHESEDEKISAFISIIEKYGRFLAAIASAEDSEEMKNVIKLFVVSPKTFIKKRVEPFTIAINSYPGISMGFYYTESKNGWLLIPSLPIGLDFAFTKPKINNLKGHSFNIFAQILDLGAVFKYRLTDPTTELSSNITFEDVISLGLNFGWGVKNSPLMINAGVNYLPNITDLDNPNNLKSAWQIGLRASWDIPLINLK